MNSWCAADVVLLGPDCPLPLDAPFTAAQAVKLGASRRTLRDLVRRGLVRQVVRGVYAVAQAPNSVEFRAAALHHVVSPSAVIVDRTAAWLHGVDVMPRNANVVLPPISMYQKPGTRARRDGVDSGERKLLKSDVMEINGLSVTTPLRTACDLGRQLWRFDALAALDQFLRLGVPHEILLIEVERFKGYRGVIQLRTLAPLADARAESVPESALRLYWYDAGLPKPVPQFWVPDDDGVPRYRIDLALPDALFGAEYYGEEFHSSTVDREHDEHRQRWLEESRRWHIEVFVKTDLYGFRADPIPRLTAGLAIARAKLSTPISYPTLMRQASLRSQN